MLDKDPWIAENSPIEPERLHAIGVINFFWSQSEFGIFCIFSVLCGLDIDRTTAAFQSLSSRTLIEAIRNLARTMPSQFLTDPDGRAEKLRDAICYATDLFEANRQNRNSIVHAYYSGRKTEIRLQNRSPKKSWVFKDIPSSLEDLRAISTELKELCAYLSGIIGYLFALNLPNSRRHGDDALPPLPSKPSLPPVRR